MVLLKRHPDMRIEPEILLESRPRAALSAKDTHVLFAHAQQQHGFAQGRSAIAALVAAAISSQATMAASAASARSSTLSRPRYQPRHFTVRLVEQQHRRNCAQSVIIVVLLALLGEDQDGFGMGTDRGRVLEGDDALRIGPDDPDHVLSSSANPGVSSSTGSSSLAGIT